MDDISLDEFIELAKLAGIPPRPADVAIAATEEKRRELSRQQSIIEARRQADKLRDEAKRKEAAEAFTRMQAEALSKEMSARSEQCREYTLQIQQAGLKKVAEINAQTFKSGAELDAERRARAIRGRDRFRGY